MGARTRRDLRRVVPGRHRLATVVVLAAVVLVACGGGDDPVDVSSTTPSPAGTAAPGPTPSAPPSATPSPTPSVDPLDGLAFTVDQEFWHSGFRVVLGEATVEARRDADDEVVGHDLLLAGTFDNLAEDEGTFRPDLEVVLGDTTAPASTDTEWPTVGGGLSTDGVLVFEVEPGFDPATAVLVVGSPDQARAEVPLQPDAGTLVALPPEEVDLAGTMSLDLLDITVTGGQLRWDLPAEFDEVPAGDRALTLDLTATSRKSGNWGINATDFALALPDGTAVPADDAVLASLPGNDSGLDTPDLWLRFLVPEDTSGTVTLRITPGDWWLDGGPTEAAMELTLP
ncbi:hypothetical protein [Salsipaludibacter albus]|uniref:hypothetical protein n=1 Tax=Salsipaludibacter albus TaxID=2849650 RepID=UPI001EE41A85|nr:hypothetical protein [Salsipaludibacter albus]MBY5161444.1 hypothetical protein [Salsipaludibacter albus]